MSDEQQPARQTANAPATSGLRKQSFASRILGQPLSVGNALLILVLLGAIVVLVTLAISPTREGSQTGINNPEYARGLITAYFFGRHDADRRPPSTFCDHIGFS